MSRSTRVLAIALNFATSSHGQAYGEASCIECPPPPVARHSDLAEAHARLGVTVRRTAPNLDMGKLGGFSNHLNSFRNS